MIRRVKAAWMKPTPYELYLHGVDFAVAHIRFDKSVEIEDFDRLPKRAQPHARGIVAQAYGINLAPASRIK